MQRVLKDSTATIWTYPPVLAQASGTPTARIGTSAVAIPDAGSNATVDSLSTDVSGDANAGRTEVSVASATWIADRKYIATPTTGGTFPILCAVGGASDTLYLKEPLPTALLTGSTIKGYRISIALTAEQTAQIGTGVVEWTATLDGVSYTWADKFEVVERATGTTYTLDSVGLSQMSPFCRRLASDHDNDFSEMIESAWRRHIQPALLAKGIKPHLFVSRSELESAHVAACELFAAQSRINFDAAEVEDKRREMSAALEMVLNSTTLWVDSEAEALTPSPVPEQRTWMTTKVTR